MIPENDTQEQIGRCLSCVRPKCINCLELEYRLSDTQDYRFKFESGQIRELYDEGLSDVQIAKRLGCHKHTIYKWRLRNGLSGNYTHSEEAEPKEAAL